MRLLNSASKQLELLHKYPDYAIVSHRWGHDSEEVLFTDIGDHARTQSKRKGYEKLLGACNRAERDGIGYVWLDTCCINKESSAELSEAINSMYKWYRHSRVCYAYLHDISDISELTKSDWFSRGWTLQELIAPKTLEFFAKDWRHIGSRKDLIDTIAKHTGIHTEILRSGKIPQDVTISQRMLWAAKRVTTRKEDRAYSLLGVLGVAMTPIYGPENDAFEDLQHKIIATKHSDQTIFAWCYNVLQPGDEDIEKTEASPVLDPTPESQEGDMGTLPHTPTGFLASSPSQYHVPSYQISEKEFRRNYVDKIRDDRYRSGFIISNNLVRISLPIRHIEGKLWKAVLRCSFDPPDDEKHQRPLAIYLQEIDRLKFHRVHLARDKAEEDQMDNINNIPGSLEQLSDEELKLEGYSVQDIDIVGRYEESSADDQPRPSAGDPDSLPEPTEADRIAQLPRHPLGMKTTNVIICGEPGVAAGRVVNFIIGDTIIKPLTDYDREAMAVTVIDTTLQSKNIRIFYIIGPRDPYLDLETYQATIRHTYQLIEHAVKAGGIHLVMLCMVGSRITQAVETNYRLVCDYVCRQQVPTMLIVTGLGKKERMENWWDRHRTDRVLQAMRFVDHACITVLQGEDPAHKKRYEDSAQMIQQLLIGFMERLETTITPSVCSLEDAHSWFVFVGRQAMGLLPPGLRKSIKREAIEKSVKEGASHLSEQEAGQLARQILDEHGTMEA